MKENFLNGYLVGTAMAVIVMIIVFSISPLKMKSSRKIIPEIQITINNKKIDTIYTYKNE